ncbi:hypothetical protein CHS0354_034439 [Potamilus streckersoni]|uniref:Small ribosomal subunit protein mS23 n=1 Tax=Potamilus streckersoni TaxID=2493646 RepID=A0AAE0S8F0_9BIVA|nr:hypothetical protein CHS0354_034439 [Potamilus streckersoni]
MAGSRFEKLGSVYRRMQGLLKSGAILQSEKPIWYDVYAAFPPRLAPVFDRPLPDQSVRQILYPEDLIRAKFNAVYGEPDLVVMLNEKTKTTCQLFVEKYIELKKSGVPDAKLFEATAIEIKEQGIRLRTVEELHKQKEQKLQAELLSASSAFEQHPSAEETFGKQARHNEFDDMHKDKLKDNLMDDNFDDFDPSDDFKSKTEYDSER